MIVIHRNNIVAQKATRIIGAIHSQLQFHRAILLYWTVIVGVLVAAPFVGTSSVDDPIFIFLILLAPLGLVGLQLVLNHLDLMPLVILISGTATAWYFSKGITPALILTGLFTGLWVVQNLLVKGHLELIKSPIIAPTLSFILVVTMSLIWGNVMADPLLVAWEGFELIQLAQYAVLILCPAALILTTHLTPTKRHLQMLVYIFIGMNVVAIGLKFLEVPEDLQLNTRGLVAVWAVGLPYGQLLFNKKIPNKYRFVFVSVILVWLYVSMVNGITWLSGWLPLLICMLTITFLKSKKWTSIVLLIVIMALVSTFPWWKPIYDAEYEESGGNRSDKWEFLFGADNHSTWGHWVLGTGPFGYAKYFMTYFPENAASTHNNYIDLFLQTGAIGSVVFIWMAGAILRVGYKLRQIPHSDMFITGFVNCTLGATIATLVAMMLGDWLTPFVLNQGLHGFSWSVQTWIFWGALAAIPSILEHERKISENSKTVGA